MSKPFAYGIDFGTTNSSIAAVSADGAELVPVDGSSTILPSIIYLDSTGNELAGNDAVRQYLALADRASSRLMSSVKSFLADPSVTTTTSLWGSTHSIEQIVSIVLRTLKARADAHLGVDIRRAVIGHPVIFVGAEGDEVERRQELARSRLESAAALAGFEEIAFEDEPTAALLGEVNSGILVAVDFGGGTFDVSVAELTDSTGDILSVQGAAVGGELFDSLLFDLKVADVLGLVGEYRLNGQRLPVPGVLRKMRTLSGILDLVAEGNARTALDFIYEAEGGDKLKVIEEILDGGHAYNFFRSVEGAKIELSTQPRAAISFHRPGIDVEIDVQRPEFEAVIRRNLDLLDDRIGEALAEAEIGEGEVDVIVRTGGSARIPAFVERLERRFGSAKLQERDSFGTVARGLALRAGEHWG